MQEPWKKHGGTLQTPLFPFPQQRQHRFMLSYSLSSHARIRLELLDLIHILIRVCDIRMLFYCLPQACVDYVSLVIVSSLPQHSTRNLREPVLQRGGVSVKQAMIGFRRHAKTAL